MIRRPPRSTLFPDTTRVRSPRHGPRRRGGRVPGGAAGGPVALGGRGGALRPAHDRRRLAAGGLGEELRRSEEHTPELQSRHTSYAVFCLKNITTPTPFSNNY